MHIRLPPLVEEAGKVSSRVNSAFGKFERRGHFPLFSPLSPSLMASFSENNKSSFRLLGLQLLNFEREKASPAEGRVEEKTEGQGHLRDSWLEEYFEDTRLHLVITRPTTLIFWLADPSISYHFTISRLNSLTCWLRHR